MMESKTIQKEKILTRLCLMNDLVLEAERETASMGYIEHLGELRLQIKELKKEIRELH